MNYTLDTSVTQHARKVPFVAKVRAVIGNKVSQISWLMLGIFVIPFWILIMQVNFHYFVRYWQGIRTTEARCTKVEPAGKNKYSLLAKKYYTFEASDNIYTYVEVSPVDDYKCRGGTMLVDYKLDNPVDCKHALYTDSPFPIPLPVACILPLMIFCSFLGIGTGIKQGKQTIRLVKYGNTTKGTLAAITCKVPEGRDNDGRKTNGLYEFNCQFVVDGKPYGAKVESNNMSELAMGQEVTVLYNPAQPSDANVIGFTAGGLHIDDMDGVAPVDIDLCLISLILPVAVIMENLLFAVHLLHRWRLL